MAKISRGDSATMVTYKSMLIDNHFAYLTVRACDLWEDAHHRADQMKEPHGAGILKQTQQK